MSIPATLGTETGHYTAQSLSPIAGTKLPAIAGDTLDEKLACSCFFSFVRIGHVCGLFL